MKKKKELFLNKDQKFNVIFNINSITRVDSHLLYIVFLKEYSTLRFYSIRVAEL